MANPSNYRYDAYSDIPSSITLTERHLVPAISPYIVTLAEVPVKSAPSTTSARYINTISGSSVTYGDLLTEVSATPVSGQYYPDYHTNADNNENWNTGQILFAAADAGKMIEVTYLAKGTLTGVTSAAYPSWWRDRGDGSDGDFYPTGNVTIGGRKNYRSVYIPAGVTVTVNGFVDIRCQGMFINEGYINATGVGALGGSGGYGGKTSYTDGAVGNAGQAAGGGGAGGGNSGSGTGAAGGLSTIGGIIASAAHVSALVSDGLICCGSGGGGGTGYESEVSNANGAAGGNGGGFIRIVTMTHKNVGTYSVQGAPGGNGERLAAGGGGGGGGAVCVITVRNLLSGTALTNGGSGGAGGNSGGGIGIQKNGIAGSSGWYRIIELGVN